MSRPFLAHTTIDRPFDEVAALVSRDPASAFTTTIDPGQRTAVAQVAAPIAGVLVERHLVVEVGEPRPRGTHELVVPVSWHAAEHAGAYPTATGMLELWALSNRPPRTQISLVGTYEVPLGWLGDAGDRLAGERIVTASIEALLQHVTSRLSDSDSDSDSGSDKDHQLVVGA